ncbi:MAG: NUDIX hydrolase [Actinomycetota bacterium]|nr:NUDIX hydrolase [Actinomycetota bacterium]
MSAPDRRFARIGSQTLHEGKIFDVVRETFRFADGEEAERDIVRHGGAVGVLAHDDEQVYLVRQPREAIDDPDLLEIPAGRRDVEGEDPLATARRELAEEIGMGAERWELVADFFTSAGMTDERMTIYRATGLHEAQADSGEDERIELVPWSLSDLDGAIAATMDAKTLVALLWLKTRL